MRIIKPKRSNPLLVNKYRHKLNISDIMAKILINRSITISQADALLNEPEKLLEKSSCICGAEDAAKKIAEAINVGKHIYVYADYDVDGITSGSLLERFFKSLDIDIEVNFPERANGYGITTDYADYIIKHDRDNAFVIAADNGIAAIEPANILKSADIPFVILDHHEPTDILPDASAICDAWIDNDNICGRHLCACGIVWKVCILINDMLEKGLDMMSFLPLVAIGTIADVMPQYIENRAMVKIGLRIMGDTNFANEYPNLAELISACDIPIDSISAKDIAWSVAPKLNSCSRMGDVNAAVKIFSHTQNNDDIINVMRYDKERKKLSDEAIEKASRSIDKKKPVIVFDATAYPSGIAGIIAGKISEQYDKPAIVCQDKLEDGSYSASCRNAAGIDVKELINYAAANGNAKGAAGHAEACGAEIYMDKLDGLYRDARKYIDNQKAAGTVGISKDKDIIETDAEIAFKDISQSLGKELTSIPYLQGDEPLFCTPRVAVEAISPFKNKEHLVLKMTDSNGINRYAVKWYGMEDYKGIGSPKEIILSGYLTPAKFSARVLNMKYDDAIINIHCLEDFV